MITLLEWAGTFFGLLGAALLATNTKFSKYGWIAFLVANFALIAFAVESKHYGLLAQQIGFTFTSGLGIYRSGIF